MAAPKTPKLGLNKIDRSATATTTYNLKTYHDDVMDTLDAAVGAPDGLASLGPDGKVPAAQLPSSGQPFDGGNSAVVKVNAVVLENDTRTNPMTYTAGKLTKMDAKDGATVVMTTTWNYTGDRLDSIVEVAGGVTATTTYVYDANNNLVDIQGTVA